VAGSKIFIAVAVDCSGGGVTSITGAPYTGIEGATGGGTTEIVAEGGVGYTTDAVLLLAVGAVVAVKEAGGGPL